MTTKEDDVKNLMTEKLFKYYNKTFKGKVFVAALYDAMRQETIEFVRVYTSYLLLRDSLTLIAENKYLNKNLSNSELELLNLSLKEISNLCDNIRNLLYPISEVVAYGRDCHNLL